MSWPVISAEEALVRLQRGARALDVRSPKEYLKGSLPGVTNVPILNDEHRHLVGLKYKQAGQSPAIELANQLVAPIRQDLILRFKASLADCVESERLLICWRGGLRSATAAEWLEGEGFMGCRVAGGYKAIRHELLQVLEDPPPLILLSGLTGVGKSELLGELSHLYVVDMEACANHRGSAFGAKLNSPQPTQQTFENLLGVQMFNRRQTYLVEDESMMIGYCAIPGPLRERMAQAPMVILEDNMENRTARVFAEYVADPVRSFGREVVRLSLLASLDKISQRLGGLRARAIREVMEQAFEQPTDELRFHALWIESLLREYYDPRYVYSNEKHPHQVLFRGTRDELKDFLTHRLARRGP